MKDGIATRYLIDTSCLVQAFRAYYPFDIFPGLWDFFKKKINGGNIILIEKVANEINRGNDELKDWMNDEINTSLILNVTSDVEILSNYAALMQWADKNAHYLPQAKADFAEFELADPWLVATAISKNLVLVSQEIAAPASKKIIKLPDVCQQFDIKHITTIDLLRTFKFSI